MPDRRGSHDRAVLRGGTIPGIDTAAPHALHSAHLACATESVEIAQGTSDLSARTEQTAANLQKAASSMDELSATIRQTADHSELANKLSTMASEVATRGGQAVEQVVTTTMGRIVDSVLATGVLIGEISRAAHEQSAGAAISLKDQAERLAMSVSQFEFGGR